MSDQVPAHRPRPAAAPRGFLGHPLVQLTLVRVREFTREPEAVFWALFFPILITAGLGVAFRSRPAEVLKVAAAGPAIAQALRQEPTLDVTELDQQAGEAAAANREGRAARGARCRGRRGLSLRRYESRGPHRADAGRPRRPARRRPRRSGADARRHHPRGRLALHRLPGAGPRRPRHHEQYPLGPGLFHRRLAPPEADEAARSRRRCRARTTCSRIWSGG